MRHFIDLGWKPSDIADMTYRQLSCYIGEAKRANDQKEKDGRLMEMEAKRKDLLARAKAGKIAIAGTPQRKK